MPQAHHDLAPDNGAEVEESARRALCASYRNFHFRVPGSPHSSRVSEVDEGAPVNVDEGWTERVKCGKNASPQKLQYPNSVRPDDCSTRSGLERLPTDLAEHWEGFKGLHPRYNQPYYDALVHKMLA